VWSSLDDWLDDRLRSGKRMIHMTYDLWSNNVNRVRGDRLCVDYIAHALVERKYSQFFSVNLDPGLPLRKLYDNLRRLGVIAEMFNDDVDVKRLSSFFFYETVIEHWD
jgi:hypothetical protein